jgi:hypothetical protein
VLVINNSNPHNLQCAVPREGLRRSSGIDGKTVLSIIDHWTHTEGVT